MLLAQGMKSFEIWHPEQRLDGVDVLEWMLQYLQRPACTLPAWGEVHET